LIGDDRQHALLRCGGDSSRLTTMNSSRTSDASSSRNCRIATSALTFGSPS
jgi:hypothetical protein